MKNIKDYIKLHSYYLYKLNKLEKLKKIFKINWVKFRYEICLFFVEKKLGFKELT